MSNIWAFGCSFTEGVSLNQLKGLESTKKDIEEHWLEVLKTLFEKESKSYTTQNIGRGGHSQKSTLYHLISQAHRISSGDIVLIGHTTPSRDTYVYDGKCYGDKDYKLKTFPILGSTVDNMSKWLLKHTNDKEAKKIGRAIEEHFTTLESADFKLLEQESNLIDYLLYNFGNILKEKGIEVYHWGYDLWFINYDGKNFFTDKSGKYNHKNCVFENIQTWTKNKFKDLHWSPKGNKRVANFFKYCIDNKYETFTIEALQEFLNLKKITNSVYKQII